MVWLTKSRKLHFACSKPGEFRERSEPGEGSLSGKGGRKETLRKAEHVLVGLHQRR